MAYKHIVLASILACAAALPPAHAALVPVTVPYASRASVDSDADSIPDIFDNAPGIANDQADLDNDGIGDVIDPTPASSNPFLGDPGLALFPTAPISAATHLLIPYTMTLATPPGAWGHIDLDFAGDGSWDATYFGPLDTNLDTIDISPALFVGPGMSSQSDSILTDIVVVAPEPASAMLLSAAALLLLKNPRPRRSPHNRSSPRA